METRSSWTLTSADQPQLILEGLHPFYTYSFLIAAVTISPGPYSEIFTIQMPQAGRLDQYAIDKSLDCFLPMICPLSYAAPVSSPQNVSVDVISSVSISVTWQPPLEEDQNGIITSYTVRLYDTVSGQTTLYQTDGVRSQFFISTLHPYYEYDVSVAAETVEIGPFSAIQRVQTLEDRKLLPLVAYLTSLIRDVVFNQLICYS